MVVAAYRGKLAALTQHCDLHLLAPARWGAHAYEESDGGDVPTRRARALLHGHNHLHIYPRAAGLLKQIRPQLVHIDEEPYSAVTWQLARACAAARVPCVFFAWQNLHKRIPQPFRAMRRYVFANAHGGIAGTTQAADVLRSAGCALPLAVIPQIGIDPALFRPHPAARAHTRLLLGIPADAFVAGFAGRLVAEKGVHVLIDALGRVAGARLLVLGDGPERTRLEERAAVALQGRAYFAGHVPSTAMADWLSALDVLVLPSLRSSTWEEQFGRVLVEAMACGVPVIGSATGEIPHVIGNAGLVVEEGDAASLARAIEDLASSPARRRALAERARSRALDRYTHAHIAAETAAFYQVVMEAA
jgi:glycosyltransferase involved in cell wall biosynthesis